MKDKCFICDRKKNLEQHHLISRKADYLFNRMIGICSECHGELHGWKSRGDIADSIKMGLDRVRKQGKTLGRPNGSKDKVTRKKEGYLKRWLSPKLKKKYYPNEYDEFGIKETCSHCKVSSKTLKILKTLKNE